MYRHKKRIGEHKDRKTKVGRISGTKKGRV
jgi:hypothetical protein